MGKLFSTKDRAVHLGPFPMEKLQRQATAENLAAVSPSTAVSFHRSEDPTSIINAMAEYQAMLDAVRVGLVNPVMADCPSDIQSVNHLKGFCFNDASMVGICQLADKDLLAQPFRNPEITDYPSTKNNKPKHLPPGST